LLDDACPVDPNPPRLVPLLNDDPDDPCDDEEDEDPLRYELPNHELPWYPDRWYEEDDDPAGRVVPSYDS
ncbi:MAG TPA: hypothetical protein VF796_10155, partial [Humisphaera sp.]